MKLFTLNNNMIPKEEFDLIVEDVLSCEIPLPDTPNRYTLERLGIRVVFFKPHGLTYSSKEEWDPDDDTDPNIYQASQWDVAAISMYGNHKIAELQAAVGFARAALQKHIEVTKPRKSSIDQKTLARVKEIAATEKINNPSNYLKVTCYLLSKEGIDMTEKKLSRWLNKDSPN